MGYSWIGCDDKAPEFGGCVIAWSALYINCVIQESFVSYHFNSILISLSNSKQSLVSLSKSGLSHQRVQIFTISTKAHQCRAVKYLCVTVCLMWKIEMSEQYDRVERMAVHVIQIYCTLMLSQGTHTFILHLYLLVWVCHYLSLITVYNYYLAVTICNTEVNHPPRKLLDFCWKVNSPVHDFRGDYSRNLSSSFCVTNTDYLFFLCLLRNFEFGNICNRSAWLSLVATGLWVPASVRGSRGDLITADLIVWTGPGFWHP